MFHTFVQCCCARLKRCINCFANVSKWEKHCFIYPQIIYEVTRNYVLCSPARKRLNLYSSMRYFSEISPVTTYEWYWCLFVWLSLTYSDRYSSPEYTELATSDLYHLYFWDEGEHWKNVMLLCLFKGNHYLMRIYMKRRLTRIRDKTQDQVYKHIIHTHIYIHISLRRNIQVYRYIIIRCKEDLLKGADNPRCQQFTDITKITPRTISVIRLNITYLMPSFRIRSLNR